MNPTNDMYLYNNDGRPPKERISDLEAKVESMRLLLDEVSQALTTIYKFIDNQNSIDEQVSDILTQHHSQILKLIEDAKHG